MTPLARQSFVDYLHQVAEWRRRRAEEYDRDERNLVAAAGLEELAAYIQTLPADDERLLVLGEVAVTHDEFRPGQQTSYEVGRFRFHYAEASLDGFLNHLTRIAVGDSEERGRFAGKLPEGDDPWSPEWRTSKPGN